MPRADGIPTLAEILVDQIISSVGKTEQLDGKTVIAELAAKLEHNPSIRELEDYLGVDRSRKKPWPLEEDCKSCPEHKDGPHRFGCFIHGARANQPIIGVNKSSDGTFHVASSNKKQ